MAALFLSCSLLLLLALEVVLTAPLGVMLADLVIRVMMMMMMMTIMMVIIDNDDDDGDHLLSWDSTMAMVSVPTSSMMSTSSPAPAVMSTCATLC